MCILACLLSFSLEFFRTSWVRWAARAVAVRVTAYHTAYHNDRMRERVDSQETAVFRAKGGDATFGLLIPPGVEQGGAVDGIAWFGGIEKSQYKSGFQASFVPGMCPCFALTLNFSGR